MQLGRRALRRPAGRAPACSPRARALTFVSAEEPYVDTLTLAQLRDAPDAMLALEMDGRPLTREHGAPARVVMPQMYGYKGVKWVRRITVTDRSPTATGSSEAMTATRRSVTPTASEPRATVPRFGATERAVHWVHAAAFFALLATGLALYLPVLASVVGDRPLLKAVHLGSARRCG